MKSRYQPWAIRDFSSGQIEKTNDNILPDNAAYECRNFISSRIGGLSKRKGQVRLNDTPIGETKIQGLHPYYERTSDVRRLIAMVEGLAYLWNGTAFNELIYADDVMTFEDTDFPAIGTMMFDEAMFDHPDGVFPIDDTAMVMFADAVNYIIAMNGVNRPWKWSGTYVTFLENAPRYGRYPILHKEKIFCVDREEPSTLVWSESFDPEDWPALNYWDIRKGDGDEITCLQKHVDDLIIFKNNSIHVLKGTSLADFSIQEVSSTVGCVGPNASTVHDMKVYFVSDYGLHITNGMNVINISELIIPDTWDNINKDFLNKAVVSTWKDLIYFALPYDGSEVNSIVIVYDPKKQAFFPMTNIAGSCYTYYNDGEGVKWYYGENETGYVNILDQGDNDFDEPIVAYWRGKYFDMGYPEVEKKSRNLYVQDSPKTSEIVDVSVSVDYGDYNNLTYLRSEGLTREYLFELDANRWRYVSPLIQHDKLGPCDIRGIVIPYKAKRDLGVRKVDN